ncbi:hypothetical protein HPP92_000882 [Vanilla planifolia]|uniref:Glycosyltransferases n=1 Tax=Vanilla planifolia TaxID=51239 RepID=A0A835RYB3_VANPL|nr:hypothetical protein HPP92_000882 [Vanilla planifolia]
MGSSSDRSKKKVQLWKKAFIHFSLCFVTGFFTGFAPTTTTASFFSSLHVFARVNTSLPPELLSPPAPFPTSAAPVESNLRDGRQLILITTTRSDDPFSVAFLQRLAQTLRMVPPPLLWIVVGARSSAPATARLLRWTSVMYRHVTYGENFTDAGAEAHHQRNLALAHVEHHRLTGIVHFASYFNSYHPRFFDEIREVEVFGAWPVAMVSASRKRVLVEGPMCRSTKVAGWELKDLSNGTVMSRRATFGVESSDGRESESTARINILGFAFNSSILWDPERWGRPSSVPDSSQDSIRFLHQMVLEDEAKIRAIPADCSRVMLWHLHLPGQISP